jgi:hypothetical protein
MSVIVYENTLSGNWGRSDLTNNSKRATKSYNFKSLRKQDSVRPVFKILACGFRYSHMFWTSMT